MGYRVVLTKNGVYKHTLYKCKGKETAFINYRLYKKENEVVLFPRKFINSDGLKSVKYQILIVKDIEEGDVKRNVRDHMGKFYIEQPLNDRWTILDSAEYNYEETFWVYGHDPKKDRLDIRGIIKKLMKGAYKAKMVKSILVVHNKLVIHNEDEFEMIICKNKTDAQRLHHELNKAANKGKIKSLLFLGTATPATVSNMYEYIHEQTGWAFTKIRRTTTRP